MTGREFENFCVKKMQEHDYWALRIPQNMRGAQPFDIIAVDKSKTLMLDCKVVSKGRTFSFDRIEDNQLSAMEMAIRKTKGTRVGFVVLFERAKLVWFFPYAEILLLMEKGEKSVDFGHWGFKVCDVA